MTQTMIGKVALVTGGGSGIGRATAVAFARQGARVVVSGRRLENLEETVHLIQQDGGEALPIQTDISRSDQVEAMLRRTVQVYKQLNYAFNNAGGFYFLGGGLMPAADITEESWDRVVNINLKGTWLCMKFEIAQMLKQGSGAIVNNSSTDGLRGAPYMAAYSASKHGVLGLTRTSAVEYATLGIRINAVCPGWIETAPVRQRILDKPEAVQAMLAQEPIGRFGKPEEVAETVVWLCSDAASFITGHAMTVDGGYLS